MAPVIDNTIAVFGESHRAAIVGLRKALKPVHHCEAAIVLDYTGRGAMLLGTDQQIDLSNRRVRWYDTADRRRPAALFQFGRSPHLKPIMLTALRHIRRISGRQIEDATLAWTSEAAYELSIEGTVGLGALLKSISSPTVRKWFLSTQPKPDNLGKVIEALTWALGYPAVFALTESGNPIQLIKDMHASAVSWFECRTEHFERKEYALITAFITVVIRSAIYDCRLNRHRGMPERVSIVHLFPPADVFKKVPSWVEEENPGIRHIAVHRLQAARPLNPLGLSWAEKAAGIWVVGGLGRIAESAHRRWLSAEERKILGGLKSNQLWVKSNRSGACTIATINASPPLTQTAAVFRQQSSRNRRIMPVLQMTAAVGLLVGSDSAKTDIYRRLSDVETLRLGWLKVQKKADRLYGTDGVTVERFKQNLEYQLKRLSNELKNMKYRSRSLRRTHIPKPDGGSRPIGIACVRDRVVQSACLLLIEPLFEPDFSHRSFAFRPGRSAHQALTMARSMIAGNRKWIVIADIRKCFDSLDHEVLLSLIARRIADHDLLDLIRHWLTVDVFDFQDIFPLISGVPQGLSLSPLLANIYLDPLDKRLEEHGLHFVRYADDIIILESSRENAQKALGLLKKGLLDPLHLELKPAKTQFVALDEGFTFLGFWIDAHGVKVQPNRIERIERMLLPLLKALGKPDASLAQRAAAMMRINAIVRGFRNYFLLPDETPIHHQLALLDQAIDQAAGFHLPNEIFNDPAWICRERFLTARPDRLSEISANQPGNATSAYPQAVSNVLPAGWIIDDEPQELKSQVEASGVILSNGLASAVKEDEDNIDATFLDHDGRLYVLRHGTYLTQTVDAFVLRKRKRELFRCPLNDISMVFIQGYGITMSIGLQLRFTELKVPMVMAAPNGFPLAVLNTLHATNSALRVWQVLKRDDPHVRCTGLNMIAAKVGNQASVLRYFAKYRKKTNAGLRLEMNHAADSIRDIASSIRTLNVERASLRTMAMGLEGQAGAMYWTQVVKLLPPELGFRARKARGAQDPINQCLNYMYALLYGEVWQAVARVGLDPYFGLVHGSQRDDGSLVFDLIEEFRAPFVDRLVLAMAGRGFQPEIGSHRMLKTAKRRQLTRSFKKCWAKPIAWLSRKLTPAAILDHQAQTLRKLFLNKGAYHPYRMRW